MESVSSALPSPLHHPQRVPTSGVCANPVVTNTPAIAKTAVKRSICDTTNTSVVLTDSMHSGSSFAQSFYSS
jgi:hypothetical protein